MRVAITLAALTLLALSLPVDHAVAQGMGMGQGMGRGRQDAPPKSDSKAIKADEQAYKDALKRIPDKKADPWGNMR